jgi:hypothetical protein
MLSASNYSGGEILHVLVQLNGEIATSCAMFKKVV